MTKINFNTVINADGVYVFPLPNISRFGILQISGGFGSGSPVVTPGYDDGVGNFVAFSDASNVVLTTSVPRSWQITMPISGLLALSVSGSTSPSLVVNFKPLPNT